MLKKQIAIVVNQPEPDLLLVVEMEFAKTHSV